MNRIAYDPTVNRLQARGVRLSVRGRTDEADRALNRARCLAPDRYDPERHFEYDAHLGRILRDQTLNAFRGYVLHEVGIGASLGAMQNGLHHSLDSLVSAKKKVPKKEIYPGELDKETEDRLSEIHEEIGATHTALGRTSLVGALVDNDESLLKLAISQFDEAETFLASGDNPYYDASNLLHRARALKILAGTKIELPEDANGRKRSHRRDLLGAMSILSSKLPYPIQAAKVARAIAHHTPAILGPPAKARASVLSTKKHFGHVVHI